MDDVCVDLTNLRSITGGDAALEAELFEDFVESSGEVLQALESLYASDDHDGWYQSAHALKSVSSVLGAERLARLAADAQQLSNGDADRKQVAVKAIKDEHQRVVQFLRDA